MSLTVDFKFVGENNRGLYYPNSKRIVIYPSKHETIEDLFKTIQHELIHYVIDEHGEELDEDQEERAIFLMSWADDFLI